MTSSVGISLEETRTEKLKNDFLQCCQQNNSNIIDILEFLFWLNYPTYHSKLQYAPPPMYGFYTTEMPILILLYISF